MMTTSSFETFSIGANLSYSLSQFCEGNEADSQMPPPPRFAWSPSPAIAGADKEVRPRDACASELASRKATNHLPPNIRGGGSADRRTMSLSASRLRMLPPKSAPMRKRATRTDVAIGPRFGRARLSALHRGSWQGERTPCLSPGRASRDEQRADTGNTVNRA
jgi:hypothetical protein